MNSRGSSVSATTSPKPSSRAGSISRSPASPSYARYLAWIPASWSNGRAAFSSDRRRARKKCTSLSERIKKSDKTDQNPQPRTELFGIIIKPSLEVTMSIRFWTALAFTLALFAGPLKAQSTLGTITGLITDSSGAVIPNAVVVATNTATGAKAQTITSSTGNYVVPNLPVGPYEVTVAISGFKAWTRSGINVSSNDNLRIDVTL